MLESLYLVVLAVVPIAFLLAGIAVLGVGFAWVVTKVVGRRG